MSDPVDRAIEQCTKVQWGDPKLRAVDREKFRELLEKIYLKGSWDGGKEYPGGPDFVNFDKALAELCPETEEDKIV